MAYRQENRKIKTCSIRVTLNRNDATFEMQAKNEHSSLYFTRGTTFYYRYLLKRTQNNIYFVSDQYLLNTSVYICFHCIILTEKKKRSSLLS